MNHSTALLYRRCQGKHHLALGLVPRERAPHDEQLDFVPRLVLLQSREQIVALATALQASKDVIMLI